MMAPNYLVVQAQSNGACGSRGCSIDVFSYEDGVLGQLMNLILVYYCQRNLPMNI